MDNSNRTPRLRQRLEQRKQQASNQPSYVETQAFELIQDIAKDRRQERRWRLIRNFLLLGVVTILFVSCIYQGRQQVKQLSQAGSAWSFLEDATLTTDHIAVVSLLGVIAEGSLSAQKFNLQLKRAFENPHAKAVFIHANSPGGSPVQSALINDAIVRLKEAHSKPIYAIVTDVCASGCYYAIANVDEIIVNASSLLGSIGVRLESFDLRGLMQKIGIQQRLLTAGENKALLNPFGSFPSKEKDFLQQLIDETHQEFIKVVEKGRGTKLNNDNGDLYSGLIWTGRQSIQLGLADALGDLQTASTEWDDLELRFYDQLDFWQEFFKVLMPFQWPQTANLKTQW